MNKPPPPGQDHPVPDAPGARWLRQAAVGLVPVHLAASLASLSTTTWLATAGVSVNLALFAVGMVAFVVAFLIAAGRSRHELVWFGGAFLLTGGSVGRSDRRLFHAVLGSQIVIGFVAAGVRPFSPSAFAILAVLAGFGLTAWYGSRFGHFPERPSGR